MKSTDKVNDNSFSLTARKVLNVDLDGNASIANNIGLPGALVSKTITFDGATTNDIGDYDGTGNPGTLFTVTGLVAVSIVGVCTTVIAGGSSTVEVGTSASTAALIALTTGTEIDANEIWHDASPDASIELTSVMKLNLVSDDIILTVKTANVTSGVIDFHLMWTPISPDGNVVAA